MVSPSGKRRLRRRKGRLFSALEEIGGGKSVLPIRGRIKMGEGKNGLVDWYGRAIDFGEMRHLPVLKTSGAPRTSNLKI